MHTGGRETRNAVRIGEGGEECDDHLAFVKPRGLAGAGAADLQDHVAAPRISDRRTGLRVRRVRKARCVPGARLDDDVDALREPTDRLGNERHPAFAGRSLLWNADSHAARDAIASARLYGT